MKEIALTQGKVALVDDDDFSRLNQFKWYAKRSRRTFYAVRNTYKGYYKYGMIGMHQAIVNAPDGAEVDHRDGDGLNNQRSNLRISTHADNMHNSRKQNNNTSGYKGVDYSKASKKWRARILVHGESMSLGYFKIPEDAARAYDDAARKYFGEFAKTNFG